MSKELFTVIDTFGARRVRWLTTEENARKYAADESMAAFLVGSHNARIVLRPEDFDRADRAAARAFSAAWGIGVRDQQTLKATMRSVRQVILANA